MNEIKQLQAEIAQFCDERDWGQFHNAKDLSAAITIEAGELLECFLWKQPDNADMDKVGEELADVFIYALRMADKCGLDVGRIVRGKITRNAEKYPVDKCRGKSLKYTEIEA